MKKERLYLFDTTLSSPFARSREACEHEQTEEPVAQVRQVRDE
ncbi:MAG: hypothetical protein ACRED5_10315 [Propylenella sp.]